MFIYFDLGNVVLNFSHDRMCRQISAVTGAEEARVRQVLFDDGLKERAETGECGSAEFCDALCETLGVRPERAALERSISDIFSVNLPVVPLIAHIQSAGYRIGLLSNICETHWRFIAGERFEFLLKVFDVLALSYQIGAVKPNPRIYAAAAELAGVAPRDMFFTDDIASHVAAARMAGFDSVQFTTAAKLAEHLHRRGVRLNY